MAQVSSIKKFDVGYGKSMTAFRIFPPYLREFAETELGGASIGRDIISDHERLEAFMTALESASVEDVELARPALLFHLEELDDIIGKLAYTSAADSVKGSASETVMNAVTEIAGDARILVAQVDASPRSTGKASMLMGCMAYLAELLAISNAISMAGDPDFETIADKASSEYVGLSREIATLRRDLAQRYPDTAALLTETDVLLSTANATLASADLEIPVVTHRMVEDLTGMAGDRTYLYGGHVSHASREDAVGNRWYQPLDKLQAEKLRRGYTNLFRMVDEVYNRSGFLSEMKGLAVAMRFSATEQFAHAGSYTEAAIRSQKKSLYDSVEEHKAKIEREVEGIDASRRFCRENGSRYLRLEGVVRELFDRLSFALHPDRPRPTVMEFEMAGEDVIVGTVPGRENAVVIARDRSTSTREAVYMAVMPASELDDIRIERVLECKGTHFGSVDEAVEDLNSDTTCKGFYFGDEEIDVSGAARLVSHHRQVEAENRKRRSYAHDEDTEESLVPF